MKIHRDALAQATDDQLKALRDNVLRHWDGIEDDEITVVQEGWPGTDAPTLLVNMGGMITIGIEPDGYTHS